MREGNIFRYSLNTSVWLTLLIRMNCFLFNRIRCTYSKFMDNKKKIKFNDEFERFSM